MLCVEIREAFFNSKRATESVHMFFLPFVPSPEVEVIDDGPNFNGSRSSASSSTLHPTWTMLRLVPYHMGRLGHGPACLVASSGLEVPQATKRGMKIRQKTKTPWLSFSLLPPFLL
jgi:hypothetical protein